MKRVALEARKSQRTSKLYRNKLKKECCFKFFIAGQVPVLHSASKGRVQALDLLIVLFVLSLLLAAAVRQFHTYNKYVRSSSPATTQESVQESTPSSAPTEQE